MERMLDLPIACAEWVSKTCRQNQALEGKWVALLQPQEKNNKTIIKWKEGLRKEEIGGKRAKEKDTEFITWSIHNKPLKIEFKILMT